VKICNQLVENVKKYGFAVRTRWSELIFAGGQIYPGKGPKKNNKGPNQNVGASKCYLGPNFLNLVPKGSTWQSWLRCTVPWTVHRQQGRTQGGILGLTLPPGAWYFTKTLLPAQRRLIVFAYFLLVNLSTECKCNGMNLHANFKEHCKWAKK